MKRSRLLVLTLLLCGCPYIPPEMAALEAPEPPQEESSVPAPPDTVLVALDEVL